MTTLKGRELDACIAEQIMGWSSLSMRFSTDIAAAFQVVEKMREEGWLFSLSNDGTEWSCQFSKPMGAEVRTSGGNAATVICLAALEAKGATSSVKAKV